MNVRTAESMTSTTSNTPPANHSTFTTTSTAVSFADLRYSWSGRGGRRSRFRSDWRRLASSRRTRAAFVGLVARRDAPP